MFARTATDAIRRDVSPRDTISGGVVLRIVLLFGAATAVALAAWIGGTFGAQGADPELVMLMRGIAAIKGGLVLAGIGLLLWRFGHPVPAPLAGTYLAATWLSAAAAALVWQQVSIPAAAVLFHVGELTFLGCAWFDRAGVASAIGLTRLTRRASRPQA